MNYNAPLSQGELVQDETPGNWGEMGAWRGGTRAGYGIAGGAEGILARSLLSVAGLSVGYSSIARGI